MVVWTSWLCLCVKHLCVQQQPGTLPQCLFLPYNSVLQSVEFMGQFVDAWQSALLVFAEHVRHFKAKPARDPGVWRGTAVRRAPGRGTRKPGRCSTTQALKKRLCDPGSMMPQRPSPSHCQPCWAKAALCVQIPPLPSLDPRPHSQSQGTSGGLGREVSPIAHGDSGHLPSPGAEHSQGCSCHQGLGGMGVHTQCRCFTSHVLGTTEVCTQLQLHCAGSCRGIMHLPSRLYWTQAAGPITNQLAF